MKIDEISVESLSKTFKRLKRYTKNFSTLIVRDPLDHLDFEVNLKSYLGFLVNDVKEEKYLPQKPYYHLSPKSKGINRPTVVLDIIDAVVYRFCIEQIEDQIFSKRKGNIRGGIKIMARQHRTQGEDFYEISFKDWKAHMENLRLTLNKKPYVVTTDISSYFENINIMVLKDLVRSVVKEKRTLLNLLFYFLESTKKRSDYEVNNFTGLLQESTDASRMLAYYFLSTHDEVMTDFCKKNNAEYYRFVDDMTIAVDDEVTGRLALKTLTESLRNLNLVSSIEKTEILESSLAYKELLFNENDKLDAFEGKVIELLKNNKDIDTEKLKIPQYYKKMTKEGKNKFKNWIKILKRFYSLCSYTKTNLFYGEIEKQLVDYPLLFNDRKIIKYLISNYKGKYFRIIIKKIDKYLRSKENLYSQLETNLFEAILAIPLTSFSNELLYTMKKLSLDVFYGTNNYLAKSDYARALGTFLIYKFCGEKEIQDLACYYISKEEKDPILKKYLICVSLTTANQKLRESIVFKANKEQHLSINRLVNFIKDLSIYKKFDVVTNYIKKDNINVYYNEKYKFSLYEKYENIRAMILSKLIEAYG